MKNASILLLALCLLALPSAVPAQLAFTTNNGVITITGYSGAGGALVIPGATNGHPVTSIRDGALQNLNSLTSVVIPDSVTNIGQSAFLSCYGLTNASIGSGVTNIGGGPFANCRNLKTITVNPTNLFFRSTNGVLFDKNLTALIQFPGGLGGSYTIPNSVVRVGFEAFNGCTRLTNVLVGSGVTNIAAWAFFASGPLAAISVDTNNPAFSSVNGVLFDKHQTTLVTFPPALGGSYTVPDGVTNILDYAFSYCNGLNQVTMPASLTSLEWSAFEFCGILTAVYFLGNAPDTGGFDPFAYANATIYYLPGTSGWDVFFADTGQPGVLWLPQVQTGFGGFGVQNHQFGFNFTWAGGKVVVVEACTNLVSPVWLPVQTNIVGSGAVSFSDPQPASYPGRFYRLRSN